MRAPSAPRGRQARFTPHNSTAAWLGDPEAPASAPAARQALVSSHLQFRGGPMAASLPLHARYQAPSAARDSAAVPLPRPVVLAECDGRWRRAPCAWPEVTPRRWNPHPSPPSPYAFPYRTNERAAASRFTHTHPHRSPLRVPPPNTNHHHGVAAPPRPRATRAAALRPCFDRVRLERGQAEGGREQQDAWRVPVGRAGDADDGAVEDAAEGGASSEGRGPGSRRARGSAASTQRTKKRRTKKRPARDP